MAGEVLCEGVVALLLGHIGRGLAPSVGDFEVAEGPCEFASNGHTVAPSGEDERGIPIVVCNVRVALHLEEQYHDLRVAIVARPVQRRLPSIFFILPIDRCPLRNESLGFCRISIFTGIIKFLVDVQSAFQGRVSACGPAASAASYLCFGTRSRRAARAGGNAYMSKPIAITHSDVVDAEASLRRVRRCSRSVSAWRGPGRFVGPVGVPNASQGWHSRRSDAQYPEILFFNGAVQNPSLTRVDKLSTPTGVGWGIKVKFSP